MNGTHVWGTESNVTLPTGAIETEYEPPVVVPPFWELARLLADHHDPGIDRAFTEHPLRGRFPQRALAAGQRLLSRGAVRVKPADATAGRGQVVAKDLEALRAAVAAQSARLMERLGLGATVTAAIVTLGLVALVAVLGYFISGPLSDIVDDSDQIAARLEQRVDSLRESVKPLEQAAAKIEEMTGGDEDPDPAPQAATDAASDVIAQSEGEPSIRVEVDTDQASTLSTVMEAGPSVLGQIVFTLFLLFFLIASGDLMYLKVVQSFDTLKEKRAAYMALREIEASLGSYLGAITLINAGLAICVNLVVDWLLRRTSSLKGGRGDG